ncbi:MAG: hypothetical protein A3A10_02620 [Candidatus Tagabacteria bacterium RIFCSPLOWO2_01_FULL_42_9]|uniref:Glycosyltransferase 2-like domain-containing protein n=1 Tax=Candidatus Tagabacteria bacterium RIFCSPLOWO2_01_FULL_42_9 TaxID=1802296 RepID=A0A1G2LUF7_9BACT|nr:MAG: hypothetical protein A3A10_02620 [Candidatus Tagabacteria bacterium RIFCSPLOWO2_01_FULL_42_9]
MEKTTKPTISIIVPAFKEAGNLRDATDSILTAVDGLFADYEILIIDCLDKDGKDDGTRKIAEEMARENPHIKSAQNSYVSLGYKYWQGVALAKFEYITFFPGDNETSPETIKEILRAAGKADMVISYIANMEIRERKRRIISKIYTFLMNMLFGMNLRYFNGPGVYKAELLKALPSYVKENHGFSYNAEILVRLIKAGHKYIEVPMYLQPRTYGQAKALNAENFKDVVKRILKLFWETRILVLFSQF